MKRFLLPIFAAALPLSGALAADAPNSNANAQVQQQPAPEPNRVQQKEGNAPVQDGIGRVQGSTQYFKNGQPSRVTYELKLSEGITARPDGSVTLRDGRTIQLQEGQMVSLDGEVGTVPTGMGNTNMGSSRQPAETGPKRDFGNNGNVGPQGAQPNTPTNSPQPNANEQGQK